jgi:hypothetical protein
MSSIILRNKFYWRKYAAIARNSKKHSAVAKVFGNNQFSHDFRHRAWCCGNAIESKLDSIRRTSAFARSTVESHAGKMLFGKLSGVPLWRCKGAFIITKAGR